MAGIELFPQHLAGHAAVGRQGVQPGGDHPVQPVGRGEPGEALAALGQHGGVGAGEPGVGDGVLVPVMLADVGHGEVQARRDLAQAQAPPSHVVGDVEGGVEDTRRRGSRHGTLRPPSYSHRRVGSSPCRQGGEYPGGGPPAVHAV